MKYAVIESIGAITLMAAATLPLSCVPAPTAARGDLQPLVAAAGQHSMMARTQAPVAPTGVCSTCGAKNPPGGGFLGDGTVKTPCPECNAKGQAQCSCPCGGKGYVVRDGSNWACECKPNCPCKCKDGKCSTAR